MPQLNLFFVSINSILSGAYNTHYAYAQTQALPSVRTVNPTVDRTYYSPHQLLGALACSVLPNIWGNIGAFSPIAL